MKEEQSNFLSLFIRWLSIAKLICEHFKSAFGSSDFWEGGIRRRVAND